MNGLAGSRVLDVIGHGVAHGLLTYLLGHTHTHTHHTSQDK